MVHTKFQKSISLILSVLLVISCLMLPAAQVSAADTTVAIVLEGVTRKYKDSFSLLDLCNAQRASKGLEAWQMDRVLMEAAMKKATELSVNINTQYDPAKIFDNSEEVKTKETAIMIGYDVNTVSAFFNDLSDEEEAILSSAAYVSCGAAVVEVNRARFLCIFVSNKAVEPVDADLKNSADSTADYAMDCPKEYLTDVTTEYGDASVSLVAAKSHAIRMKIRNHFVDTQTGFSKIYEVYLAPSCTELSAADGTDCHVQISGNAVFSDIPLADVTLYAALKDAPSYKSNVLVQFITLPITTAQAESIPDQQYTGEAIMPEPVVTDSNHQLLKSGVDYRLEYRNNVSVGKATISIIGIGSYSGTITVTFSIVAAEDQFSVSFTKAPDVVNVGETSVFTVAAENAPSTEITYQFDIAEKDSQNYTLLKAESNDSFAAFKPEQEGEFTLRVTAKDAGGQTAVAEISVRVFKALTLEFTSAPDSFIQGNSYNLSVKASGGTAPYEYACFYVCPDGDITKPNGVRGYSSVSDFLIDKRYYSIDRTGEYVIIVNCRDKNGTVVTIQKTVICVEDDAFVNTSTISAETAYRGDVVYIQASCIGGTGQQSKFTYKFSYNKDGSYLSHQDITRSNWTSIAADTDDPTRATLEIKFQSVKVYQLESLPILVQITDTSSKTVSKVLYLVVRESSDANPLINLSEIDATPIPNSQIDAKYAAPYGSNIIISGKASGGQAPYLYTFHYMDRVTFDMDSERNNEANWHTIPSDGDVAVLAGEDTQTYVIRIVVLDSVNRRSELFYKVKVYKPMSGYSSIKGLNSSEKLGIVGYPIQMNGNANMGVSPFYCSFAYRLTGTGTWTNIPSMWNDSYRAYFVPQQPGFYDLRVIVRDHIDGDNGGYQKIYSKVQVLGALNNTSILSDNQVDAGTQVTIKGSAEGGYGSYNYTFAYRYEDDEDWTTLDVGGDECGFTPERSGKCQIKVTVSDTTASYLDRSGTACSYHSSAEKILELDVSDVNLTEPLQNQSTMNSTLVAVGNKFVLNGAAQGGTPPYQYTYQYKRSNRDVWSTVKTAAPDVTVAKIKPTSTGTFDIKIIVEDSKGEREEKEFTAKASGLQNQSYLKNSAVLLGTYVKIYAKADGGAEDYKYNYFYKRSTNSKWNRIGKQDTAVVTAQFKPTAAVPFDIRVSVTDSYGMTVKQDLHVNVSDLQNLSTISTEHLLLGKKITINGKAASDDAQSVRYSYYYKRSRNTKWNSLGTVGTDAAMMTFKPSAADSYDIKVIASDSSGAEADKIFKLQVYDLVNTSGVVTKTPTAGKYVTIQGAADGGTEPYTYTYYYKRSANSRWIQISTDAETAEQARFKPQAAADYDLKVVVTDQNGLQAEKVLSITVS